VSTATTTDLHTRRDGRAGQHDDRGRGAEQPQHIPAKGWRDVALR
jgi:hypothetical protein